VPAPDQKRRQPSSTTRRRDKYRNDSTSAFDRPATAADPTGHARSSPGKPTQRRTRVFGTLTLWRWSTEGNWRWRLEPGELTPELAHTLRAATVGGRAPA